MALTEKDRHLSAYVNMTSDQAVADFLHHRNLVRGISVAMVLVLAAVLVWMMTWTVVNLIPAFSLLLSFFILGERLQLWQWLACGLVFAGVLISQESLGGVRRTAA